MSAWFSAPLGALIDLHDDEVIARLQAAQVRHFRSQETSQIGAWTATIGCLGAVARARPDWGGWWVALEYPLARAGSRPDAILLSPRAIYVLEFKDRASAYAAADQRQVEDYALDLFDFHAGSRGHPIIPVLVATAAPAVAQGPPLNIGFGVLGPVRLSNGANLAEAIAALEAGCPGGGPPLDGAAWLACAYEPVPAIIEAARMIYARHDVAAIRHSRADRTNLAVTSAAVWEMIDAARAADRACVIFITGIPGAGKTLCGLDVALGRAEMLAAFLTGNPALVHVLRAALVDSVMARGKSGRQARQEVHDRIIGLPAFRNQHLHGTIPPPERVIVIDEAQRCWARDHARRKTVGKAHALTESEPAHLLEMMARHQGFWAVICLVGSGQEIHDGEGGLAEWGRALAAHPEARVYAPPEMAAADDPRQRLGAAVAVQTVPALHLNVAMRHIGAAQAAQWVDAVLRDDVAAAQAIAAAGPLPFRLTRSRAAMMRALRHLPRGARRAGLIASSGAKRLRALPFAAELDHMDERALALWFLRDPAGRDSVRGHVGASGMLEVAASEFAVQGLEIDYAGIGWDLDLRRGGDRRRWLAQRFRGTAWQRIGQAEAVANQINTYRVLLSRARHLAIILVPPGEASDPTRPPGEYDAIAAYLTLCGVGELAEMAGAVGDEGEREAQGALW